jgi:hypothetical protein
MRVSRKIFALAEKWEQYHDFPAFSPLLERKKEREMGKSPLSQRVRGFRLVLAMTAKNG